MSLTQAEKQRRCREQIDADKNTTQTYLRRDRERQSKYRQLVKTMFKRQKCILATRKWQRSKRERWRQKKLKLLGEILPPPSPPTDAVLPPGYAENCLSVGSYGVFHTFLLAWRYASTGTSCGPASVCHKSEFCWNGWMNQAGIWHWSFFTPIIYSVKRKFVYFQK